MYKATYKCRMCGEEYVLDCTSKEYDASNVVKKLCDEDFGKLPYGITLHVAEKHACPDGSIGYADFVGFRKENNDG